MAVRPNFTGVEHRGDTVRVMGESGDDTDDILDIQVSLIQADRIVRERVVKLGTVWDVEFPADGFVPGPATAFGWETRRENVTTTSWAEGIEIPERDAT